jgi:hypothetical protein
MKTRGDKKGNCNALMILPKLIEASKESLSERPISWPIFQSGS